MFQQQPKKLSNLLPESIKDLNMEDSLNKTMAKQLWVEIMGERVNQYTASIFINKGIMYIRINSSVFRHELQLNKQTILEKIQTKMGNQYITEIVFQ